MKKGFIVLLAALLVNAGLSAQSTYKVDPYHSSVNFKVKHLGISFVAGKFDKFEGTIVGSDVKTAKVDFSVDVNTINTSVEMRDNHLRSADFFDAEKFPKMKFSSTSFKKSGKKYTLSGNLTIKDVTRPVTFEVVMSGPVKAKNGGDIYGFTAKTIINRFDYRVAYDPELKSVGKDVHINLYLEFGEQK